MSPAAVERIRTSADPNNTLQSEVLEVLKKDRMSPEQVGELLAGWSLHFAAPES